MYIRVFIINLPKNWSDKNIKKSLKIGLSISGAVIILCVFFYLIIQIPVVQTYLAQKLTSYLSEKYHASITVQGVSIAFFNKVILEEVLIKDQNMILCYTLVNLKQVSIHSVLNIGILMSAKSN